jgi:hypothetical protein
MMVSNYDFARKPPVLRFVALRVRPQLENQIGALELLLSANFGDPPPPGNDKLAAEVRDVMPRPPA